MQYAPKKAPGGGSVVTWPNAMGDGLLVRRVTSPKGVERRFREHSGQEVSCLFMYSLKC